MPTPAPARLKITAYADPDFKSLVAGSNNPLTVWINPSSYTHTRQIAYADRQAAGSPGMSSEFNRVRGEDLSFDLVFDATGVIPPQKGQTYDDGVAAVVNEFLMLTTVVNGAIHRPNYLILAWGQLQFRCVLSTVKTDFTLFRPDGTPLRAKVSVTFKSFVSEITLAKQANLNSPDMTHIIQVTAGDTLPALCHRVYGDSRYYMAVARYNGLARFRALVPGTTLLFPPLSGDAA